MSRQSLATAAESLGIHARGALVVWGRVLETFPTFPPTLDTLPVFFLIQRCSCAPARGEMFPARGRCFPTLRAGLCGAPSAGTSQDRDPGNDDCPVGKERAGPGLMLPLPSVSQMDFTQGQEQNSLLDSPGNAWNPVGWE